ncbi:MAG TPA: GNAT family N-acetyltransferase [Chitinophagaceae bacterium]|nr:GNAT family N-acetyltransferase [Chitinophagaceae bacterium]
MPIIIRRATREDCPRILELVRELAAYEKAPQEVTVSLEEFAESGFGDQPVWWGLVAVAPGVSPEEEATDNSAERETIVGFALYYIRFSTWKGERMYLEDIIVTKAMRGKGIGKRLFDRLVEEAKEKKLHGMVWQVLHWNTSAIHFYQKYGASLDAEWVNGSIDW